jgi:MFS family permease
VTSGGETEPSLWRNRDHRSASYTLFSANAVSMVGNRMALLAIPWFVLATTGSAARTGITAFFSLVPVVLSTFFGGVFVDRFGFKTSSVVSDVASGLAVVAIPVLFSLNLLPFWLLQVLVFLGALLDAPGVTARDSMLPELATERMPVERLAAIRQVIDRGAGLLGAPLAGFLITAINAENVLYVNAATFAVSAVLIGVGVPNIEVKKAQDDDRPSTYLSEIREGLRFLRLDRLIFALVAVVLVLNLLDGALSSVIYPVYVEELYGSAVGLGLIFGVSGGAAMVGALIYSWIGHNYPMRTMFLTGFIVVGVARLALLFFPPLWVVLAASAVVGLAAGPLNPIMDTTYYRRIPAAMRARVLGALTSFAFMATPVGVLIAGFAVEGLGLRTTLIITLGAYLLVGVSLTFNQRLREMDDPPRTPATPTPNSGP